MSVHTTSSLSWSNEMGHRSHSAWLLLVKGEEIVSFGERTMPGWVVVLGTDYRQNGKWSHTTFRLELAVGVRAIAGHNGWETGRFVEGLRSAVRGNEPIDRWPDLANALGVSVPAAMSFLRQWRPKAAEALDIVDAQLEALEASVPAGEVVDTVTITVSFGSPTNRAIADGWWSAPKQITGQKAQLRLIDSTKGWEKGNVVVVGMTGTVLSAVSSSGMHGGYRAVTVAVVPGTETQIPAFVPETRPEPEPSPYGAYATEPTPEPAKPATLEDLKAKFGR